jgi:hypothetical protein
MYKATIMKMHASSYSSSQDFQPKVVITFYVGGITRTLLINIASHRLHLTYCWYKLMHTLLYPQAHR